MDVITISGGTDGQMLYVYWNHTSGNEDVVFIVGQTFDAANNKAYGATFCKVHGSWRIVGSYKYQ